MRNHALVALHIRVQTAAAYEMLGKRAEAREVLEWTLRDADPDGLLMPLVESYHYLKDLLESFGEHNTFAKRIVQLGEDYEARRKQIQDHASTSGDSGFADGAGVRDRRSDGRSSVQPGDCGKAVSLRRHH